MADPTHSREPVTVETANTLVAEPSDPSAPLRVYFEPEPPGGGALFFGWLFIVTGIAADVWIAFNPPLVNGNTYNIGLVYDRVSMGIGAATTTIVGVIMVAAVTLRRAMPRGK